MEEKQQIKFKDLTRDYIEDFISKMSKEDKKKLKEYIEDNPKESSSAFFTMVKSYIYNYYFRAKTAPTTKKSTFADTIDSLLQDDEDET